VSFHKDDSAGVDGLYSPWDLDVSPDGYHVYVAAYLDNAVSWFDREPGTGAITYGGLVRDGVDGVDGLEYTTSVAVCPSGNYVYATARIDEALTWYARDRGTGVLTFKGAIFDGGGVTDMLGQANDVAVSPDGHHIYVGALDRAVVCFEMQGGADIKLHDVAGRPSTYQLNQNSPNPFVHTTKITFAIPALPESHSRASLVIHNSQGQIIRKLFTGTILPGKYSAGWNGCNQSGMRVPAGVYFCELKAGEQLRQARRIILDK
jgi:6-phosphogluconolactonase (cycloisomerase 2 family)